MVVHCTLWTWRAHHGSAKPIGSANRMRQYGNYNKAKSFTAPGIRVATYNIVRLHNVVEILMNIPGIA